MKQTNKLAEFNNLEITLLVENDDKIDTKANVVNMNKDANKLELLAQKYVELRKGKEDIEAARKVLSTRPFYAMMLLATGRSWWCCWGTKLFNSGYLKSMTFKAIGPKPGIKTISSVMIMHKEEKLYFFSDISVNPKPDLTGLVDIATNACWICKSIYWRT
nr:phosphate acyltransferase [Mycoplasmopsis bovis]